MTRTMPGSSQETEVTGGKSSCYRFTADRDGEPSGHDMVVLALCGMCREMIIRSTHFYKHVNLEKVTTHLSLEPPAHLDPHAYERRAKYVMNTLRRKRRPNHARFQQPLAVPMKALALSLHASARIRSMRLQSYTCMMRMDAMQERFCLASRIPHHLNGAMTVSAAV